MQILDSDAAKQQCARFNAVIVMAAHEFQPFINFTSSEIQFVCVLSKQSRAKSIGLTCHDAMHSMPDAMNGKEI